MSTTPQGTHEVIPGLESWVLEAPAPQAERVPVAAAAPAGGETAPVAAAAAAERRRVPGWVKVVAIGAAVGATVLGVQSCENGPDLAGADDGSEICEDKNVTYYMEQAPEDSNFWGPKGVTSDPIAAYRDIFSPVASRTCEDPTYTAGYMAAEGMIEATPEAIDAQVLSFIENPDEWNEANDALREFYGSDSAKQFMIGKGTYHTLYQIKGENGRPELRQSTEDMDGELLLMVIRKDGSKKYFKLGCGYQPVQFTPFSPDIPPLDQPDQPGDKPDQPGDRPTIPQDEPEPVPVPDKVPVPLTQDMPHPQPGAGGTQEQNGDEAADTDFDGYDDEGDREDVDPDGDGLHNAVDNCPNDAETYNGYQDEDGCSDEVPFEETDEYQDEQDGVEAGDDSETPEAEPTPPTTEQQVDRGATPDEPED